MYKNMAEIEYYRVTYFCESTNNVDKEENKFTIEGYRLSLWRALLTCGLILMSGCVLLVIFYWRNDWALLCTHLRCPVYQADRLLLKDMFTQIHVSPLKLLIFDKNSNLKSINYRSKSNSVLDEKHVNLCTENLGQSKWIIEHVQINGHVVYFELKKIIYFWNVDDCQFKKISGLDEGVLTKNLVNCQPLSNEEVHLRATLFGSNSIAINVPSIPSIFIREVLSPFYVFQAFSLILWYYEDYSIYATAIALMTVFSIIMAVYETREARVKLHNLIEKETEVGIKVLREHGYVNEKCENVVTGDIIQISPEGQSMLCDAVLIEGVCVVDESMLTGESLPVAKIALCQGLDSTVFKEKTHNRSVLLRGTQVLQARPVVGGKKDGVRAVVIRTGWKSLKGKLLQAILYPKSFDHLFEKDALRFVGLLACLAALGMIYALVVQIKVGNSQIEIILNVLNISVTAVPPAVPAIIACGTLYALSRLKKRNIFCISPSSINMSGDIDAVVFDKTGTLTQDGLYVKCILPSNKCEFGKEINHFEHELSSLPLIHCMAACHSLNIIRGKMIGDYADTAMFNFTTWNLTESNNDSAAFVVRPNSFTSGVEISLLRVFPFESSLQRQSSIVQYKGASNYTLFVKGSPEMIASLCCKESLPANFEDTFSGYAKEGNRIFAAAFKPLFIHEDEVFKITREIIEHDFTFVGLIVSENKIKEQTVDVITHLRQANIRPVMATGDNLLTALSVARTVKFFDDNVPLYVVEWSTVEDCLTYNLVENHKTQDALELRKKNYGTYTQPFSQRHYYAMTGATWEIVRQNKPQLIQQFALMGVVFARMASFQKAQLVEALREMECNVAMCGDGTNDCEALRAANTGLSLSKAEASVACAFTAQKGNIGAIIDVICEGRCSYMSSYGNFQFIASCCIVSLTSTLLLYFIGANMSDGEFLYNDLIVSLPLYMTFGLNEANPVLDRQKSRIRLLSMFGFVSFVAVVITGVASQITAILLIRAQPWFTPFVKLEEFWTVSYEQTAVFSVAVFQYITYAIIFSKGLPFRKPTYTNYIFSGYSLFITFFTVGIMIGDVEVISKILKTVPIPSIKFKFILLGIASSSALMSFIFDVIINKTSLCDWLQKSEDRIFEKLNKTYELTDIKCDEENDLSCSQTYLCTTKL